MQRQRHKIIRGVPAAISSTRHRIISPGALSGSEKLPDKDKS